MSFRVLLWLGIILNAIVLIPATIMAINAVTLAQESDYAAYTLGVVGLFFALPVFCVAAPLTAWQRYKQKKDDFHTLMLVITPLVYAAFLVVFLFSG
jgi:bacteriorhodopsin